MPKSSNPSNEDSVLAVYTHVSPTAQPPFFQSSQTDVTVTELNTKQTNANKTAEKPQQNGIYMQKKHIHSKSKSKEAKPDPVLATYTHVSPSAQPPFFQSQQTDVVVTELHKTKSVSQSNREDGIHHTEDRPTQETKINKDKVLAVYTQISPTGQPPFFKADTTDMVVTELHQTEVKHGIFNKKSKKQDGEVSHKSNEDNKHHHRFSLKKDKSHGKERESIKSPVLEVSTHVSPTAQPPFFKSDTTDVVVTELHQLNIKHHGASKQDSNGKSNSSDISDEQPAEFKLY